MKEDTPTSTKTGIHPLEAAGRKYISGGFEILEAMLYGSVALLLVATAGLGLVHSGQLFAKAFQTGELYAQTVRLIESLLLVLMLVEILHTVRVSIKTHRLITVPFLTVGIIASVRRLLVITLEASNLVDPKGWDDSKREIFYGTMIEMGILAIFIGVLAASIVFLRKTETPCS